MQKVFLVVILLVASAILLFLANQPAWQYHLRVDVDGQYYSAAKTFFENHSLKFLGYNEYQPGAVLFFVSLSVFIPNYVTAVNLANILLFVVTAVLYFRFLGLKATIGYIAICLSAGPILLYRFDLLVGLYLILSIFLLEKKRYFLSLTFLAFATTTKIFPGLVFPYYLWVIYRQKGLKTTLTAGMIFFVVAIGIVVFYLTIFQAQTQGLLSALSIHPLKHVHVESIWGSLVTIINEINLGHLAFGKGEWGIYGINSKYIGLPLWFYNWFWVVPFGIVYLRLLLQKSAQPVISKNIGAIILTFLVFSKILTAQYLFWLAVLVPAVSKKKIYLYLTCIILFLSQLVYPLGYNELLGCFYGGGKCFGVFYILTLRNFLLFILFLCWHIFP